MDDLLSFCSNPDAVERVKANRRRVAALLDRGVTIPCPETLEVGPEVDPNRIHPTVVLHAGVKLSGARTALLEGVRLGAEAPVALDSTVCGPRVRLEGGCFSNATFLEGASMKSAAHVREGTLLEEQASAAHAVGLKQTLLFPYVTLGSLINFCDCLMAGGTSRKDHSEVGSGYIHFNFTPRGDKATPSLFGDVPRGVFLRAPRIFLGGLAATVGPTTVGFGSFLGPGQVFRRPVGEGAILLAERQVELKGGTGTLPPEVLTGASARVHKNVVYIAQLAALYQWYVHARALFAQGPYALLYASARETLELAVVERLTQLERYGVLLEQSVRSLRAGGGPERLLQEQGPLLMRFPALLAGLQGWREGQGAGEQRDQLLSALQPLAAPGQYVQAIALLSDPACQAGIAWLQGEVAGLTRRVFEYSVSG